MEELRDEQVDGGAVRVRAFAISQTAETGTPEENWLQAELEFAAAYDYDTPDRDLERFGMTLARLPTEAGVRWRLSLPRGECVEDWEPGTHGLTPPDAITQLIDTVVSGKPLLPTPPLSTDPGAARFHEMLKLQRQELLRHDPGTRVGSDTENLHQHRVAARRARAFLQAGRASFDTAWRRSLARQLRDLGAVTGRVRDLDVLLAHLDDELGSLDKVDDEAGLLLLATLARTREAAQVTLVAVLNGNAYRQLLTRLQQPPRLASGVEAVPLERIARKEFRRLIVAVERLGTKPDEAAMHALRIVLKRVRYAAELASPEGKARRKFLADARGLQDLLGEYQDAVTAEQQLRSATVTNEETAVAFVAGRIAERQRGRRELVRKHLPSVWKRLHQSGAHLA